MKRLMLAAFFLEIGFVLTVVPWSPFWDRNYFLQFPLLYTFAGNNFFRGGVTGLGIINIAAGIVELVSLFLNRQSGEGPSPVSPSRAAEE